MPAHEPLLGPQRADRRSFWAVWSFAMLAFAAAVGLALLTSEAGEVPRAWLVSTIGFTWLTMSWRGVRPQPSWVLALTAVLVVAITTAHGLAQDASVVASLRSGIGLLAQVSLTAAAYRWARELFRSAPQAPVEDAAPWRNRWGAEWSPSGVTDLLALALLPSLAALVAVPIGPLPGVTWRAGSLELTTWVVGVSVTTFVGGTTTLLSFSRWSRRELAQPVVRVVAMLALSTGLLWWVLESGAVALTWLVLLPSLYVAFVSSVWLTSTYSLVLGLATLSIRPPADHPSAFDAVLPLTSAMEMLVSTCVLVALIMAFLLESRQRLAAEVDRARVAATRQSEVLQAIFDSMEGGIIVLGPDQQVRMHNSAAVALLGREMPEEQPDDWAAYFGITHVDGRPAREQDLGLVEYLAASVDGRRRVLRERATRLDSPPEDGLVIYFSDATAEHERLQELRGFAGVVAHDLRAPLTSVEGWLEMANDALGTDRADEASALLIRAQASNRRMREIIEDWLSYTVEREGVVRASDVPLASPVNVVVADLVGRAPHSISVDTPHHVHADPALVRQLLDNVLGNASKYTREGEVPQITVSSTTDGSGWILVEVSDRGIGIPPGEEERIFDEYQRGSGVAGHYAGTGLGLALCRRIVERHGGSIRATTNEHGGTTVSFTLPSADDRKRSRPAR